MIARVSQLHKSEAAWKALSDWKPEAGELVVYDPDESFKYARLKIGDGIHKLSELPFCVSSAITDALAAAKFTTIIDGGRITENH